MKKFGFSLALIAAFSLHAAPANSIQIVSQIPIPGNFTSIGSMLGQHRATPHSRGRGGDLYVRYPDATIKNLTRAVAYGVCGPRFTNGIAVRQPSDLTIRGIFSMSGYRAQFLRVNVTRP